MFGRHRHVEPVPIDRVMMETGLIQEKFRGDVTAEPPFSTFVHMVLVATGELTRIEKPEDIYRRVIAGYHGLEFGDDGVYTALLASELPLDIIDGINKVEAVLDEVVGKVNPGYGAEYIGDIDPEKAALMLDIKIKQELGLELPHVVSWSGGVIHL